MDFLFIVVLGWFPIPSICFSIVRPCWRDWQLQLFPDGGQMNHSLMGKYITVHTCIFWYHVPFCRTPLCRSSLLISLSTHYSFHLMSVYIKKIFLFYIEKYFLFSMAKFDQTSHIEYLCVKGFCDQVFDQRSRLKSPLCKILVWCTFSLILVYGSYFT